MKKKILSALLATTLAMSIASAEQPKAAEYREIMSSGSYYIEYESDYGKQILAVGNGKRMSFTRQNKNALGGLSFLPLVGIISLFTNESVPVPNTLYTDGKYYNFDTKKKGLVATETELNDPNLNPRQGWDKIKHNLHFAEPFTVFAPNEPFNKMLHYKTPQFVESGEEKIKDKSFKFDKYVSAEKSLSGANIYEKIYKFYYNEKGDLSQIRTFYKVAGKSEEKTGEIKVKKITKELPANVFEIPKGYKVYGAGLGDMNDLLDIPVLVEDYSK